MAGAHDHQAQQEAHRATASTSIITITTALIRPSRQVAASGVPESQRTTATQRRVEAVATPRHSLSLVDDQRMVALRSITADTHTCGATWPSAQIRLRPGHCPVPHS